MASATITLVVIGTALTFVAGPLYTVAEAAAVDLVERTPYMEAVFSQASDDRVL